MATSPLGGIASIGKKNPERKMVGSIVTITVLQGLHPGTVPQAVGAATEGTETRFGVSWLELVGRPLGDSQHALAMYEKCCGLAGVDPADLTVRQLLDAFELVDDDRPDMYIGGLPDPKAAEPVTAG